MRHLFFDSSALVKQYADEVGSEIVKSLLVPETGNAFYIARLTIVEVIAAITRLGRGSRLSSEEARQQIRRFRREYPKQISIANISDELLDYAAALAEQHALRGYDAVQLAAAMSIHRSLIGSDMNGLELVSSDSELNTAGRIEGLVVIDPTEPTSDR